MVRTEKYPGTPQLGPQRAFPFFFQLWGNEKGRGKNGTWKSRKGIYRPKLSLNHERPPPCPPERACTLPILHAEAPASQPVPELTAGLGFFSLSILSLFSGLLSSDKSLSALAF